MKKNILTLFVVLMLFVSGFAEAGRGCCSHHGGQSYCSNGRWVCRDGTYSPTCTCGSSSYTNSYTNSYTSTISLESRCQSQYGYNATSAGNSSCKCKNGYRWNNTGTACISYDSYCKTNYGNYAKADSSGNCICKDGYSVNKKGTACITNNQACKELYGSNSYYKNGYCY